MFSWLFFIIVVWLVRNMRFVVGVGRNMVVGRLMWPSWLRPLFHVVSDLGAVGFAGRRVLSFEYLLVLKLLSVLSDSVFVEVVIEGWEF